MFDAIYYCRNDCLLKAISDQVCLDDVKIRRKISRRKLSHQGYRDMTWVQKLGFAVFEKEAATIFFGIK